MSEVKFETFQPTEFVVVKPGEAYRLFPFGTIFKNGKKIIIDAAYALRFKLPHFSPAIKLGSHKPETAAGGFITQLEVREDGLYAIPEYNEEGLDALEKGKFRYHSPEVIWEENFLEDPTSGDLVEGPFIIGDALLHTPHLGGASALYSMEEIEMTEQNETVQVPVSFLDKLLNRQPAEPATVEPTATIEGTEDVIPQAEFDAKVDEMQLALNAAQSKIDEFEAEQKVVELKGEIVTAFSAFPAVAEDQELISFLAGLDEENRELAVRKFSALAEQVKESNLTEPVGSGQDVDDDDPVVLLSALAEDYQKENEGANYIQALQAVLAEHPELQGGVV